MKETNHRWAQTHRDGKCVRVSKHREWNAGLRQTDSWQTTKKAPLPSSPSVPSQPEPCSAARTLPDSGADQSVISQLQAPALFPCWTALSTHQTGPDVSSVTRRFLTLSLVSPSPAVPSLVPDILTEVWSTLSNQQFVLYYHRKSVFEGEKF